MNSISLHNRTQLEPQFGLLNRTIEKNLTLKIHPFTASVSTIVNRNYDKITTDLFRSEAVPTSPMMDRHKKFVTVYLDGTFQSALPQIAMQLFEGLRIRSIPFSLKQNANIEETRRAAIAQAINKIEADTLQQAVARLEAIQNQMNTVLTTFENRHAAEIEAIRNSRDQREQAMHNLASSSLDQNASLNIITQNLTVCLDALGPNGVANIVRNSIESLFRPPVSQEVKDILWGMAVTFESKMVDLAYC